MRLGILLCAPLFLCLPVAMFLKGALHELLLALGLVGLGAIGLLFAIHGLVYQRLPRDPLGRFPSSPGNNQPFYWVTTLLITLSSAAALLFGLAGLIANYSRFYTQ